MVGAELVELVLPELVLPAGGEPLDDFVVPGKHLPDDHLVDAMPVLLQNLKKWYLGPYSILISSSSNNKYLGLYSIPEINAVIPKK